MKIGPGPILLAAASCTVSLDGPALAAPAPCIPAASFFSAAMFAKYPAETDWRGPWRAPDVRFGQAHLYRTTLRMEGVGPPDFAGRIKVATHGCGAGLTCPMFVDLSTRKVSFAPDLISAEWDYARARDVERATGIANTRLVYRRDSRLLIVLGARNESAKLSGATLFEWRAGSLRLIRFIPQQRLCPGTDHL